MMEHPVTIARSKIAARLEAEIIGTAPLNPYQPQPKGRAEQAMAQYIRGAITRKELRLRLTAIASELHEGRFAAIRIEAAKIRPRDLVAAVEKFRKLQADCVPDGRVLPCSTFGHLSAGAMGTAHPTGTANAGDLTDQQFENKIACDLCGKLFNRVGHVPLPSSTDDGSK